MLYMVHKVHTIKKNNIQSNFENFHMTSNGIIIFLKSFSAAEEGCSPIKPEPGSPNSIHSEEITAHVATENHQSPGKDSKQEIPKGKGKLKKKNSLRKMLSCFSSKAAQAD